MTELNEVNCGEFISDMDSKSRSELRMDAAIGLGLTEQMIHIQTFRELNVFVFELGNGVNWEVPLHRSTQIRDEETKKHLIVGWNFDIFGD